MNRAFTLTETVVIVAISVGMILTLDLLIYNFNNSSNYEQSLAASSSSASGFMRELESLTVPADNVLQTHSFTSGTRTSSSTALVLEIPSVDSSGNTIANTFDYAAFYTTGTTVYRLLEANAASARVSGTKRLSTTLGTLSFTYNNADFTQVNTVTVDVQMQTSVKQTVLIDHRTETIRLRNF